MKSFSIGFVILGLAGIGCGRVPNAAAPPASSVVPPVSSFEIPLLVGEGESLQMDSLLGQVVLLDFCATWSAASRAGIPDLNELQSQWGEAGLSVVGLCVDQGDRAAVSKLVADMGVAYSVGWADERVQDRFGGVRPIPTRILLDREGQEVGRFEGAVDVDDLRAVIQPLLGIGVSPRS